MAYDDELADRVRNSLGAVPGLTEKRMFGGLAFLINGNMAVAASSQGGLMVRVDPAQSEELIADGTADRMVMRGREMDGWLRVATEHVSAADELDRWTAIGLDYARSLPAK